MLKDCGYLARPVTSGRLALQAARSEKPDLILLDTAMPEMDGYEVCQQLKLDQQLKGIPVIFISVLSQLAERVKAFEVGGVDFIKMPFQFEEVRARVDAHIKLYRLQMSLENQVRRQVKVISEAMRDRLWLWLVIFISITAVLIITFIIMAVYEAQDSQNTYQSGYYVGYYKGYLTANSEKQSNSGLIDPSYEQVLNLIADHDCTKAGVGTDIRCQYASDCLMQAAASEGIKSHLVILSDMKHHRYHALVAFDTLNRGSVYVEPQIMKVVEVDQGKYYSFLANFYLSEVLVYP